jgi:hypothetical protein
VTRVSNLITQHRVMQLLSEGWELAHTHYVRGGAHAWMQRKIGHGGESHPVNMSSFEALRRKDLIEAVNSFPASPIVYRAKQQRTA